MTAGYTVTFASDEFSVANLLMCFKATLQGLNVILAQTALDRYYALRFVSANPAGADQQWDFWKVKVAARGGVALISDQWARLGMKGTGVADHANHPTNPFYQIIYYPGLTTTTTTTITTTTTTGTGTTTTEGPTTTTIAPEWTWSDDLCAGGTARASSQTASIFPNLYAASRAFDDDYSSIWKGAIAYSYGWIEYDFGDGDEQQVEKVTLAPYYDQHGAWVKTFSIWGSQDGSNYTLLYEGQCPNEEVVSSFEFTNATAYQIIRIYIANNWGTKEPGIREITMHKQI